VNLADENGFPNPRPLLIRLCFQPTLVHFGSIYPAGPWGSDSEPDLVSFNCDNGDGDVVANHDLLADFACEN
jgi:hypothetical protein